MIGRDQVEPVRAEYGTSRLTPFVIPVHHARAFNPLFLHSRSIFPRFLGRKDNCPSFTQILLRTVGRHIQESVIGRIYPHPDCSPYLHVLHYSAVVLHNASVGERVPITKSAAERYTLSYVDRCPSLSRQFTKC
jgi:hypothetical protein